MGPPYGWTAGMRCYRAVKEKDALKTAREIHISSAKGQLTVLGSVVEKRNGSHWHHLFGSRNLPEYQKDQHEAIFRTICYHPMPTTGKMLPSSLQSALPSLRRSKLNFTMHISRNTYRSPMYGIHEILGLSESPANGGRLSSWFFAVRGG
ncbi:hypothetical protein V5O48_009814 [Marasmius crinis-equi]|uniref:Uncharacterized protein n=1 Tax=Marasmius crinis-equi TaxID=585013 RepID=A0ABR3FA68_9AGAR